MHRTHAFQVEFCNGSQFPVGTSNAAGATARDKVIGRAQALRRAMLTMIDKGEAKEAHPSYWAPFVVVGEGAAAN